MPVEVYDERDVQKTRRMRFNAAKFILPGWRTLQGCGCRLIDSKQGVSAMVSAAPSGGSHVRFANTARCGSVWSCPLCAASVTEGRAQELTRAVDAWCKAGNTVVMVTLTNSHRAHESLCDQMTGLRDALADLKASRTYKDARLDLGSHGSVRSLEVTWGEDNGWHPHIHQIEFIKGIHEPAALTAKLGAFQDSVFPVWSSACTSNGLGAPSLDRGINFVHGKTVNERIAEYAAKWGREPKAKWGVEREMAKSHTKTPKAGKNGAVRFHPFGLLDAYIETGDKKFHDLFLDYSLSFRGQRQLVWSRGLRDFLEQFGFVRDGRTDAQLAADKPAAEVSEHVIGVIPRSEWFAINRMGMLTDFRAALIAVPTRATVDTFVARARFLLDEKRLTQARRYLPPPAVA